MFNGNSFASRSNFIASFLSALVLVSMWFFSPCLPFIMRRRGCCYKGYMDNATPSLI